MSPGKKAYLHKTVGLVADQTVLRKYNVDVHLTQDRCVH